MSIRKLIAAAGGLAVAFATAPIGVLHSQATQADSAVRADSAFIRQAVAGNVLEVRLGKLAEQKAANLSVKQFAQRMVVDHTTMGNQWSALAPRRPLSLQPVLDEAQQQEAQQLEKLSGAEFDRAYMTSMIQDHQHDVDAFQSMGTSAHSIQVRQLAASGLATIKQHLTLARQVGSAVGVTNVAVVPPRPQPTPATGQDTTRPGQVTNQKGQVAPRRVGGGGDDLKADREYIQSLANASLMEVRLGQMAQQKATNPAVKRFAEQMVSDFSGWEDRWTGLASKNDKRFEPSLGHLHRQKVDRLQAASRAEFDRTYMTTVIQHFQALLPFFQKEGRSAHSAQVRNLVEDELPTLQKNLASAKRIGSQVKADTSASAKDRNVSTRK